MLRHPLRGAAAVLLVGLSVFGMGPAGAETPTEVAEAVAVDGVYAAPGGADLDQEAAAEAVRAARARGLRLVVIAPEDPQPDPAAFARRVLEASDVDAALVFPIDGPVESSVADDLSSANLRALAAAREATDPVAAVEVFTDELLTEPERSVPPIVGQLVQAVLLMALVLAGAVAAEYFLRRVFPRRRSPRPTGR